MVMCVAVFGVLALGAASAEAATPFEFGEEGTHSGQFNQPRGVAVSQESGDVYVSEQNNLRIDRFAGSGNFLMAWGWHVNEESPAKELQTCTTLCQAGMPGTGAGEFAFDNGAFGVAVDNAADPSNGDVYAVDWENYRVEKFGPKGEFILMFGGGVITGGAAGVGDLTSGSTSVTAVSTASKAFLEGQTITGAGIPPATKITRVGSPKNNDVGTITLSQPASTSGAGVALSVAAGAGSVPINERQTVTIGGAPTGGTFTLTFTAPNPTPTEATTVPIAYNAPASGSGSVQAALEALSNIGAGNVAVSVSPSGPYTVEFMGTRYADTNVTEMRAESSLEGGTEPGVTLATTVEGHSAPEICSTASICQAGAPGTADGQFNWAFRGSYIAVGPGGTVYVGDRARIAVFQPSGAWKENISLTALAPEGQVTALAVDAAGDMFVADNEAAGVHEFAPNGTEKAALDAESFAVEALAVDGSGGLYVGDSNGGFHVLRYDSAGKEIASFGSKTIVESQGMAFANAPPPGELYVAGSTSSESGFSQPRVVIMTPPPPGPVIDSEAARPAPKGAATLEAQVNPEGNETTYHFEYVDEARFKESGYASATSTAPASLTEEPFEDHAVLAELTGLTPGETYHWRVVASNSMGTATVEGQSFEETPPALIDGPWTENVASSSVTLAARINPLGASTSFRLEYGTSSSYGGALAGNVGEGETYVPVSYHLQELEPGTTYHYRIVTVSAVGTVTGADHTFTSQPVGEGQLALPDGRAWELVSPANTGGSLIRLTVFGRQAASDGSAITYPVEGVPLGENAVSNSSIGSTHVLSRRGPGGWRSQDINSPVSPPAEGESTGQLILGYDQFALFSPDLASAVLAPPKFSRLSSEGLPGTPYLRDNDGGGYAPLLTPANTPAGTNLMVAFPPEFGKRTQVGVLGGNTEHVILASPLKLTDDAVATGEEVGFGVSNLYEWSAGRLQLVNILPDGRATCRPETAGVGCEDQAGIHLGGEPGMAARAVSTDGRWVAWTRGEPYEGQAALYKGIYLRDMIASKTVQLGGVRALYQTMSSDGSRVFFSEAGELYVYDTLTGTRTDLTATHAGGEASAGVQESVSDVSEDGSYVYFVAKGRLAEGAVSGEDNLYLAHDTAGAWSTSYVATLSSEDEPSWHAQRSGGTPNLLGVTSRVSPNGRYLAFMSNRSLTGYDNVDASPEANGARDEEVYVYDAFTSRLACPSCDPSGARPHGVLSLSKSPFLVVEPEGNFPWSSHWLAGNLPAWEQHTGGETLHQPRYLSDSGRLFFDSPVALVPHDTNRLEDVYQYESAGAGGCTSSSVTFGGRSGGCVDLISSGTSSTESAFMDASETGDDVFFIASDRLTAADSDTGRDVWDAHVCSASSPCLTPSASPPACSSGDSCKAAPSPQPELFGPAPSATFSGAGNLVPSPAAVSKPLTRAQKLARALGSCRKKYKKSRKRRATCEKQAKRAYGSARKASKSTRRKGGK